MNILRRQDIVDGLRTLGIQPGCNLFVHSSLSATGHVEGGAETVVDALLEAISPGGTLMVPTFTFSQTTRFDVVNSPSGTGAVTEAVRQRAEAVRSWHPTHASCAIGPIAGWLMCDSLRTGPLSIDSPEDRMAKAGGYVLLLGVGHTANSTIHVGEAYAGAPARRVKCSPLAPRTITVTAPDGTQIEVTQTEMPGCSRGFGAIEPEMRERGLIADGLVGNAHCQLMRGADVISATVTLLRSDPYALCCDSRDCETCTTARKFIAERSLGQPM